MEEKQGLIAESKKWVRRMIQPPLPSWISARWKMMLVIAVLLVTFGSFLLVHRLGSTNVLKEAQFTSIKPIRFVENQLIFKGISSSKGEGIYVFDIEKNKLSKESQAQKNWNEDQAQPLVNGWFLEVNTHHQTIMVSNQNHEHQIVDGLAKKKALCVSPGKDAFTYVKRVQNGRYGVYLYRVDTKRSYPLRTAIGKEQAEKSVVNWSSDGEYLLLDGKHVYRSIDGKRLRTLPGVQGVWSPQKNQLVYINSTGSNIRRWDVRVDDETILYQANNLSSYVLSKVNWDPSGRYIAFPIGTSTRDKVKVSGVIVTDGKMFRYTEGEQNLKPTQLHHIQLSNEGRVLSYTIRDILKVVHLDTQETRAYQGVSQGISNWQSEVRQDPGGIWLRQRHRILFLSKGMEEKRVYSTTAIVKGFYLSDQRDRLLIWEKTNEGERLRLVKLTDPIDWKTA
ncbi:hypothetical protein [Marininema halotolerans]|uniref:Uncharacterized protein n=1 Tax=Marininema halotolerans TaxID=1155944 RepID=A0A1I6NQT1_9BACL|nr:hypothetical protein [Marininema halotolerans]SFS30243.1 hypothetical protein SAMN05444972_10127 [Marininema halotolerans]